MNVALVDYCERLIRYRVQLGIKKHNTREITIALSRIFPEVSLYTIRTGVESAIEHYNY